MFESANSLSKGGTVGSAALIKFADSLLETLPRSCLQQRQLCLVLLLSQQNLAHHHRLQHQANIHLSALLLCVLCHLRYQMSSLSGTATINGVARVVCSPPSMKTTPTPTTKSKTGLHYVW